MWPLLIPGLSLGWLRLALYGLKQAPRAWFERFVSVIQAAGFSPSDHDPALFIHLFAHGLAFVIC